MVLAEDKVLEVEEGMVLGLLLGEEDMAQDMALVEEEESMVVGKVVEVEEGMVVGKMLGVEGMVQDMVLVGEVDMVMDKVLKEEQQQLSCCSMISGIASYNGECRLVDTVEMVEMEFPDIQVNQVVPLVPLYLQAPYILFVLCIIEVLEKPVVPCTLVLDMEHGKEVVVEVDSMTLWLVKVVEAVAVLSNNKPIEILFLSPL